VSLDRTKEKPMKQIILVLTVAALAGCGVDTLSAAATAAALKKQEIEQGKKTMEQAQQKIGKAVEQAEQRAQQMDEAPEK
jgi:hypothetical protein